ncbi:PRC-barrel domain containing protein [Pseudooceanicola sp. HF7]|nr:PRC-barrel domain containing protein [Pseudooceanicola sp. HF7]
MTQSAETSDMASHDNMSSHEMGDAKLIRTRDITGGTIYTMNEADDEWSMDTSYDAVGDDWNDIGEIEDVVLDSSGQMIGVVGEIGGFLDIADKHVMIPVSNVRLVPVDDEKYALVTNQSEEELEQLEEVDEGFWD